MISKGARVKKPQGYRQAAAEEMFCLLAVCLPYYQALFFAGISGMLSVLALTCLLMFVVQGSPAVQGAIAACLKAFPFSWVSPVFDRRGLWVSAPSFAVIQGPSLAPTFQRPPPLFS